MGQLREHSFELKGYLLRTNIIPHLIKNTPRLTGHNARNAPGILGYNVKHLYIVHAQ